ncbi:hypothetical protein [Lacisediminimonas sp.]|uniref:hypothetical protein n=1 Tax=Lacisediminimonas sp. TaxID=3060582 RepID=UPI0027255811|nr:hypothetical protein [Lacisediminimonas sp.]MDO8298751.1 hypothetical protein [Lacisediminimonas sp.]
MSRAELFDVSMMVALTSLANRVGRGLLLCAALLAAGIGLPAMAAELPPTSGLQVVNAEVWSDAAGASTEVRNMADWVLDSNDHQGLPFIVIDKAHAKVFVFAGDGRLRGTAAALLGMAKGDDATPGIGNRPLSTIRPEERTTQAGRFVAALDRNLHGVEILWIDYDTALSLHRVVKGTAREQRAQRLATPSPQDNRISYGCINVPVNFYTDVVNPAFKGTNGIVYILPETRSLAATFAKYYPPSAGARSFAR